MTTTRPTGQPPPASPRPTTTTSHLVAPLPPDDNEKYAYIDRNLLYLTTGLVVSATCLIYSQIRFEAHNPVLWPFMAFTATYIIYQVISLPVNFTGRGFDLAAHRARIGAWYPATYPSVDIYLPICGEPIEMLRNTWSAVLELIASYPGPIQAYVLDDGPCGEARSVSASLGFCYMRRPDLRAYKKSGNLRYAFTRTSGEYLVIFDADFAPRRDFLAETLPYMDDPAIAIVQTPQFFRESPAQTWIENAAGAIQEVFYRSIQVARDRFGAAICVGTSAVYRRAALEPQGGPTLIPYAEDVHTGLDVRRAGWAMVYLPIVLSTGICPNSLDAFVRQQYRWCTGNAGIVFSGRLWTTPMTIPARLTYISGFFYYAYTGLLAFFGPLIPLVMLAFLPGQVRLRNFVILGPAMISGFILYPLWHRSRYGPSVWPLGIARGWAHVFAIWDSAWGRTMSWHPTRTPGSALPRFRIWVAGWSGGTALIWAVLAIWRTVTFGSAQFAVLVFFGMLNLAVVSRVIFPGGRTA
ncbi:MAG TPA: glycosyltransferase family 2 protein [Streptosporangiaceae bacterium]|jgi:cellulose synthase (UDP-forming)|nr:glycosyltransferase family 2 protein [Streptosporangiaceae bacterium]